MIVGLGCSSVADELLSLHPSKYTDACDEASIIKLEYELAMLVPSEVRLRRVYASSLICAALH